MAQLSARSAGVIGGNTRRPSEPVAEAGAAKRLLEEVLQRAHGTMLHRHRRRRRRRCRFAARPQTGRGVAADVGADFRVDGDGRESSRAVAACGGMARAVARGEQLRGRSLCEPWKAAREGWRPWRLRADGLGQG